MQLIWTNDYIIVFHLSYVICGQFYVVIDKNTVNAKTK